MRVVAVDRPVVNQLDNDIVVEDGEAGGDERESDNPSAGALHVLYCRIEEHRPLPQDRKTPGARRAPGVVVMGRRSGLMPATSSSDGEPRLPTRRGRCRAAASSRAPGRETCYSARKTKSL